MIRWLRMRVRSLFQKNRVEEELNEELDFYLENQIERNLAQGMNAEDARRAAERDFHGIARSKEECRDAWGVRRIEELMQDLRFGARMLRKKPGFSLIAILTLALGIGATTAIFSVVYAVLLRPLPYPDEDRLVMAWKKDTTTGTAFIELAVAEVRDWQEQNRSFSGLALMPATVYGYGYLLTGRGEPVQLESAKVTGKYFSILGVKPALGRLFNESDDQVNGAQVVVLSDHLWRDHFGADPNIIGQSITLSFGSFRVLGVAPPTFTFPKGVDLWTPLLPSIPANWTTRRGATFLKAIGRLKPGTMIEQAEADLNAIIARLAVQYPDTKAGGHRIVLTPLPHYLIGDARPALWAMFAATGLLLLVAAANIANLMLAQAASRRKELSVRAALGAGRGRLTRQLFCESLVLALSGGAVGVLLAYWLVKFLVALAPADIPRLDEVRLDSTALMISALCTFAVTIIFGLLPALSASRFDLNQSLNEASAKLSSSRSGNRLRSALVVAEIALTIMLLAGAALILRSFLNLSRAPFGFNPQNVLTMQLRPIGDKYRTTEDRRRFYGQLIERLEASPTVIAASGVLIRPLEGVEGWDVAFRIEGQSAEEAKRNPISNYQSIHPNFFQVFRIPLVTGRPFNWYDNSSNQSVAIVSEAMAKRYFGSAENAIGKRVEPGLRSTGEPMVQIVGVAGDMRYRGVQDSRLEIYIPYSQSGPVMNHFALRTTLGAPDALALLKRELAAIDPNLAASRIATMDDQVDGQLARPRFSAVLLNWLGGLAVLLAAVGIFGVMAYTVAQRTSELGLRIALGAHPRNILALVLGQGMKLTALGVILGLVGALAMTHWLEGLLYGVSATDPLSFLATASALTLTALLACLIPALRATKVDPMVALRAE
jgi:predicted permease